MNASRAARPCQWEERKELRDAKEGKDESSCCIILI